MSSYRTLSGWDFCFNIAQETHVVIGGQAGSGKSTLLADILYTLTAYDPQCEKLVLIDLKRVELTDWEDFPHVLCTVTEPEDVNKCLDKIIKEMNARYKIMWKRRQKKSDMARIHIVIDELAQVLRVKGAEERIDEIMRVGRASNISLIMATQNVSRSSGIPGRIYQNATCRIGLRCTTPIESRQIIGVKGCECLPQYGKCYIQNADGLLLQDVPQTPQHLIDARLQQYKHRVRFRMVG